MPVIQVNLMQGRTPAQKDAFAKEVTEAAVRTLGVKPEAVRVLLNELPAAHWYVAGAAKSPPTPPGGL